MPLATRRKKAQRGRGVFSAKVFLTSTLINGLLVLMLFLIVFPPKRPHPPKFEVSFQEAEKEPDIDNQTVDKLKRQFDPGQASSEMMTVIAAPTSSVAIVAPEFEATTSGVFPGLDLGMAPGNGFGGGLGGNGRGGGGGAQMGRIGGMKVQAARLGVVLDVSGSMEKKLPRVRRELKREFEIATIVEVRGCSVTWSGNDHFDLEEARATTALAPKAGSVVDAIKMLIATKRVDAIFWFSDLQDSQTADGLNRLSKLLGTNEGSGRKPVRFYVRSVGKKASDELLEIVERSGGGTS